MAAIREAFVPYQAPCFLPRSGNGGNVLHDPISPGAVVFVRQRRSVEPRGKHLEINVQTLLQVRRHMRDDGLRILAGDDATVNFDEALVRDRVDADAS